MKKRTVLLVLMFAAKIAWCQTAATNTGTLYISGGSDIFYAAGNFTNNSGSALTNNGQLYVKGNLTNDQSGMAIGTGTLYLNGTSAQTLSGSQAFKTYHLNTNNSSGFTFNNDLSVSGTHTFAAGVIYTSAAPNYLIYQAGSSYSGDGDTKHVVGWVKKFGSTNFTFPVGNGTVERTIALTSLSVASEFDVKYSASTPNPTQVQNPVHAVDNNEYWSVQKISGGTASVAMNWDYSKVYFPNYIISDIRVGGYNGSLWINNGGTASGNAATTGTITSSSISSFNLFTFGSISYVLPLTVISFNAAKIDNSTSILWTTDHEYSARNYSVERSDDGVSFYSIAQLSARNSGNNESYIATDNVAINGIAYYRLRATDQEGKTILSRVIPVKEKAAGRNLTLLINPVHDHIYLAAAGELSGAFKYHIYGINGQVVQDGSIEIRSAGHYSIALIKIPEPGMYTLEIGNGKERFMYKLAIR